MFLLLTFVLSTVTCSFASSGHYSFELGEWKATIFRDGALAVLPTIFSVPEFVVRRNFRFYYPDEPFTGSLNVLLLQKEGQTILVDTGLGPSEEGGQLIPLMKEMGVKPENVSAVLLTHAHPDHTSGLLTKAGGKAFPNADIYISLTDHIFWQQKNTTILGISPNLPAFIATGSGEAYNKVVKAYKGKFKFLNNRDEPFPGITVDMVGGHTPGHIIYDISSGGKTLSYLGDTIFTRTTQVQNPEWSNYADTFPDDAIVDRIALMDKIADGDKMVVLYHDDFPGLGYIKKDGVAYDFSPIYRDR